MTNDNGTGPAFFVLVWAVIWLVLVSVATLGGSLQGAIFKITPLIVSLAIMAAIGIKAYDGIANRLVRWVSLIALVVVFATINLMISRNVGWSQNFAQELVNCCSMLIGSLVVREAANSISNQRRADALRRAAEQRASNLRLSPHVLHNMLNTIYAASLRDSEAVPALILSLSAMMRYLTDSAEHEFVAANTERAFIEGYTSLLRERLGEDRRINLDWPQETDLELPPLICATLFENAVTHGELDDGGWKIDAVFEPTEKGFRFWVENDVPSPSEDKQRQSLSGLKSVSERLQLLYPRRHSFTAGLLPTGAYRAEIETW